MVSHGCAYQVGTEEEFKKFKFGGMPEGTIEIYDDRLVLYKKNKFVHAAYGAIGSAFEGKGKQDIVLYPSSIVRRESREGNNEFLFRLEDNRLAYIRLLGISKGEARAAMESFASKIRA